MKKETVRTYCDHCDRDLTHDRTFISIEEGLSGCSTLEYEGKMLALTKLDFCDIDCFTQYLEKRLDA